MERLGSDYKPNCRQEFPPISYYGDPYKNRRTTEKEREREKRKQPKNVCGMYALFFLIENSFLIGRKLCTNILAVKNNKYSVKNKFDGF